MSSRSPPFYSNGLGCFTCLIGRGSHGSQFSDSQQAIWLLGYQTENTTHCRLKKLSYGFLCNFMNSVSIAGTQESTWSQGSAKQIPLHCFINIVEGTQSEAHLQLHSHFPISLAHTAFYKSCYTIFPSPFKMENDSNFVSMLKFL